MALFNYSQKFSDISLYIKVGAPDANQSGDWVKIFISPSIENSGNDLGANSVSIGSGHLITHGIDLLADYNGGYRGMVPDNRYSTELGKSYFTGLGWKKYWNQSDEDSARDAQIGGQTPSDQLKADNIKEYLENVTVSAQTIKEWIKESYAANLAMRYKGTINISNSGITTTTAGGTTNGFPTLCAVGDVYKINILGVLADPTAATLAGELVLTGDMLVCVKNGTSGLSLNDKAYWTIVQDNVETTVELKLNNQSAYRWQLYSVGGNNINIYAPIAEPTASQLRIGGDIVPVWTGTTTEWKNASDLVVGRVGHDLTAGSGLLYTNTSSGSAGGSTWNGSVGLTIGLKQATHSALGGVIVDKGTNSPLYVAPNGSDPGSGSKYTISVNNGEIYLTAENITNALGFTPGNNATDYITDLITSGTGTPTTITQLTPNPILGLIRKLGSTKTTSAYTQFKGDGAGISVSGEVVSGVNTILVKGNVFTATANGMVPFYKAPSTNAQGVVDPGNYGGDVVQATTLLGADAKWYTLPASAFVGTWRPVKIGGLDFLSNNVSNGTNDYTLNLIAGGKTTILPSAAANAKPGDVIISSSWRPILADGQAIGDNDALNIRSSLSIAVAQVDGDSTNTNLWDLTMGIMWYNISTKKNEYVW